MAGIFSQEYFRSFAVVVVVFTGIHEEPIGGLVVMLINDVYIQFTQYRIHVFELRIGRIAGAGDELYVRVTLFDGFGEGLQAFNVLRSPVLIAHAQPFHVERRRMTELRAFLSPGSIRIAIGKFYEVQRILNVGIELVHGHYFGGVELAAHAAIDDGHGGSADVFTQLEVLQEAEAKALVVIGCGTGGYAVVPFVDDEFSFYAGTDGLFPLVALVKIGAFHDAATGKTDEAGFDIGQCLYHVGTEAFGPALPGIGRIAGYHVEVQPAAAFEPDGEAAFAGCVGGYKADGLLLPAIVDCLCLQPCGGDRFAGGINQFDA